MRFADPQACPRCRGAISGQPTCPHCRLDLASTEIRELWQTLLRADELLAQATAAADRPPPSTSAAPPAAEVRTAPPPPSGVVGAAAPASSMPTPFPAYPQAPRAEPARSPARRWSVGTILLVLGAFGLIVAGLIFVTRSWESIGLLGRTLILLGVTAVIAALGAWVTRRTLRASAEAVWTVFLALLTLDFFAAREEDLFGLGGLDVAGAWLLWGAVLLGLGVLIALCGRQPLDADLTAPSIAGGLGITIAGIGAGALPEGWDLSWRSFAALAVVGALALATRPAGLRVLTITARVVVAGFYLFTFVVAVVELVDHPSLGEVVGDLHGLPMLLMVVASLIAAAVVRAVRIPAVALAVIALCALIITPASEALEPAGVWLSIAALSAALSVAALRGTSAWVKGVRLGAAPVVLGLLLLHVALLSDVVEAAGTAIDDAWDGTWDARLEAASAQDVASWVIPLVLAALLVVSWFVPRWPEASALRPQARSIVAVAAGVGVLDAVVAAGLPVWAGVSVLLVVAAVLLVADVRHLTPAAGPLAAVLILVASTLAASNQGVSAVSWLVGATGLGVLAHVDARAWLRQPCAAAATALAVGGAAAALDGVGTPEAATLLITLAVALVVLAASGLPLREHPVRLSVEAVAGISAVVVLVVDGSTAELAVRWTIAGVVLVALSFVVADRRWYLAPGIGSLVVAYVLLIIDSGFSFVEAYTLPIGAAALGVGLFAGRRRPSSSTWLLLGPGLALALLPSIPQALADPTGLRALLLGVGALVTLAVGVRLGWQAPFVTGVAVATLLVLFNVGPYANAAPRVVLIALVSAILLGVGITWEDRVRDSRLLVKYVRSMR